MRRCAYSGTDRCRASGEQTQLKRFHDYQKDDDDHQKRRDFIRDLIEFDTLSIFIAREYLAPGTEGVVETCHQNYQCQFRVHPAHSHDAVPVAVEHQPAENPCRNERRDGTRRG